MRRSQSSTKPGRSEVKAQAHRSHAGGGHGSGHQGGGGGERSGREVQYDPAILQGHLHQGLQKDHRG